MNKKGIIGAALATLVDIIVLYIIYIISLTLFFAISSLYFGDGGIRDLEGGAIFVEYSPEVIALMKTPFEVKLDNENVELTLNEIITLYTMDKLSSEVVEEKIDEAFSKSYGSCYAFLLETEDFDKRIERDWPLIVYAGDLGLFKFRLHSAAINLQAAKFGFAESYFYFDSIGLSHTCFE